MSYVDPNPAGTVTAPAASNEPSNLRSRAMSTITMTPNPGSSAPPEAPPSWIDITPSVVTSIITPSLRASSTSSPTLPSTSTIIPNIPDTGGGGSHSNIGAIAGGVVGGLAVIGIVVIVLFWIRRRHPKQKVDAQLEDQKTNDTGDGAAMYAQASLVAKLDAGPMHATSELDARGNEINELDAGKK